MNRTIIWIWLAEVCGPESELPLLLLNHFGSIEAIYQADKPMYEACEYLKASEIKALCDKNLDRPDRIMENCARSNIGILTFDSELYPERLRNIHKPPAVLYYRGQLPNFDKRLAVAVVGTRGMTDEGRRNGYRIAYELAISGTIVVSGMAIGIDGIAHKAALDAGGTTIAVLGTPIDKPYPMEHLQMYEKLILSGGVLSEYAPGAQTHRWSFPQRNRIISGLCQGTLIVEAGAKSGALITAKTALTQGRNVFAMPGDAQNPACTGTNELIKSGAFPVTNSQDILSHYEHLYEKSLTLENIVNPAYFTGYNDTLKFGEERVAEYRSRKIPSRPNIPQQNKQVQQTPRTAPNAEPLREEPYSREETTTMLEPPPAAPQAAVSKPQSKSQSAQEIEQSQPHPSSAPARPPADALDEEQRSVLSMVKQNLSFDEMCRNGMKPQHLMVTLTYLELIGYVQALPGGMYAYIE